MASSLRGGAGSPLCATARRVPTRARGRPAPMWSARSSTCARPTTSGAHTQDRDVPQAVLRPRAPPVGDLADPQAPRHEPTAGIPAVTAPPRPLGAVPEAAARPPRPDRREVHRAVAGVEAQVLPVHCDRRLHPDPGPAGLRPVQPTTAIRFLDEVMARLPFQIETVQTDKGAEFQSGFDYHVLDRGNRPCLHPSGDPAPQRQGRAIAPDRRRRLLQAPGGRLDRRYRPLQGPPCGSGRTSSTSTDRMAVKAARRPDERLRQKTGAPV